MTVLIRRKYKKWLKDVLEESKGFLLFFIKMEDCKIVKLMSYFIENVFFSRYNEIKQGKEIEYEIFIFRC